MRTHRIVFLFAFLFIFAGCLDLDTLETRIDLQRDLSGKLLITGKGIRSNRDDFAEQKKEMQEFVSKDLRVIRQNVEKAGFEEVRTHSFCETALRCNAILVASFDNFLSALWFLADNNDFKIIRRNDTLEVVLPFPDSEREYFSMRYQGEILEHNGKKHAQDSLRWEYSDQSAEAIRFVLALE